MAHEEGAVGGYGVRFSDPEWSDDDETDPKTRVQQRGRGRNRNGIHMYNSSFFTERMIMVMMKTMKIIFMKC